jgi:Tol biopolymer transport system component
MIFILASAILAGCSKDEVVVPDTETRTQSPWGSVEAPYLAVSLASGTQFRLEKYRLDGSLRAKMLDEYFTDRHLINDPDFSPKGDKMCYAEANGIFILDVTAKNTRMVVEGTGDMPGLAAAVMSDDGSRIAFLSWNEGFTQDLNVVENINEATPLKLTNFDDGITSAGPPSFSRDGNKIAYSVFSTIVASNWNGTDKLMVHQCTGLFDNAYSPIFNREGNKLFYFVREENLTYTISAAELREDGGADRQIISQLAGHLILDPKFLVLSGDGNTLFFVGTSYGYTNLYKVPVIGGSPVKIATDLTGSNRTAVVGLDFVEE